MVPLCTLVQAVPVSFNGWGLRESVFTLYFGQIGLPRESALAFSWSGAGLIVLLSLSGAVVWTLARPSASAESHAASERMPVAVLHVCDKFGVAGSSIHGVSRLFSWWFPRFDRARFDVSLCGLKAARARARLARVPGHPRPHLGRGRFDPRILSDLVDSRAPRGARASCTSTATRPPTSGASRPARTGAASSSCTSTSPIRGMPGYQGLADRLLPRCTDRAIAVSGSTREFLVRERHVPRERVRLIWNGAPLDEFAPVSRRAGARRATALGPSRRTPSCSGRSAGSASRRATAYLLDAARAVLARHERGPLPDRRRRRPARAPAAAGPGPRHRRPHRLRRPPRRRARAARGHRRVLHLVALRRHAARALRGDGRGQGHRARRRWTAAARSWRTASRAFSFRPGTRRPWRQASGPRPGRAAAARSAWARARAASRRYDIGRTVRRMRGRCTTRSWPNGSCRRGRLAQPRRAGARGLGGPARPASRAATPPSSRAGRCPAATSRSSCSTASSPSPSAASSRHLADNGYVTLSADEYFRVLRGHAPRAGEGGGPHLRRRARHRLERRRSL